MTELPFDVAPASHSTPEELPGCRLHRLEVFNWGTFDQRVWTFNIGGSSLFYSYPGSITVPGSDQTGFGFGGGSGSGFWVGFGTGFGTGSSASSGT